MRASLKRNRDFAANVDQAIVQWRKGEAEGVVDTKLTVGNMIEQLDNQLKLKPEESPYWGPIKDFPGRRSARRPRAAAERIPHLDHHRCLPGADADARFPQERLSRPRAARASA